MIDTSHETSPVVVASGAQGALAAAQLRTRQLQDRLTHGEIDIAHVLTDLTDIDRQLGEGIAALGCLQVDLIRADDDA